MSDDEKKTGSDTTFPNRLKTTTAQQMKWILDEKEWLEFVELGEERAAVPDATALTEYKTSLTAWNKKPKKPKKA